MEALRLIRSTRHALTQARSVPEVLVEAWQACALTEAVGGHLALHGEEALRAGAQLLAEAGGHAGGCLDRPPDDWTGFGRAARLTELAEPGAVLRELRGLIHEVAEALIIVACGADTEALYWQCIDAVDAAAECKDAVTELLRTLHEEPDRDPDPDLVPDPDPDPAEPPERAAPVTVTLQPPCPG
ncbi:DUF6099 family protein [Peterkaempfera bronchialis]|uniref:DUF6099 family protein n=1 Tax=Peterkaempfera bronchialis TaxID=2126346 RepID=UPI003C2FA62A